VCSGTAVQVSLRRKSLKNYGLFGQSFVLHYVYTQALRVGRAQEPAQSAQTQRHQFRSCTPGLADPHCIFGLDRIDGIGEQRWHALGFASIDPGVGDLLLVAHVYREGDDGEEVIRIISARRASEDDFRRYQEQALD
jgi:hypothetical protein